MELLNKILCSSKTTEVDTVSGRIIAKYSKDDWSFDTHLTMLFDLLIPVSQRLTTAINRSSAESNLEEKDELRDNKVRAIHYLILGLMHHPEEVVRAAAGKVNGVFEKYGLNIINESYSSESSLIESLLEDFSAHELQADITQTSGLNPLISQLRTAQTEFEAAQVLYEESKAKDGTHESATAVKKEILSVINDKLVVYLRAIYQVNEEKYGEFVRTIAQIIDDNNVTVKKRLKNKNSEPVTED